ncbi:MAG: 2,3-bisphosphoglycerate-independent phosphoglycerate mutase [Candidatus Aenigmatarchaeota archaeon]
MKWQNLLVRTLKKSYRRIILIVADGWGVAPDGPGNYVKKSKTPVYNQLLKEYPHCINKACGNAVGLPEGSQGNSEVGHLHLGAGRIVWQPLELINRSIRDGSFFKNKTFLKLMERVRKNNSSLHITGLCSDEGVHAHINHLFALLELSRKMGLKKVYIHFIADGRDVPERSAKKYVKMIEKKCSEFGIGEIVTLIGRYYSMDRDNNWDRTKKAYEMLTLGEGFRSKNAIEGIEMAYRRGDKTDYYIQPTVIREYGTVKDGDGLIFFNFRTDRPRQLTQAFISKKFDKFERKVHPRVYFVTMTEYDKRFGKIYAFREQIVKNHLGEFLSKKGLKQLRIAETEKYAHVTYFFNGQIEKEYPGEERIMIPSPKVPSYDMKPEMSANEVAEKAVEQISTKKFDFILINFANCDLVGHSAKKAAIIKAIETVDKCVGKVVESGLRNNYTIILTADHGSVEDKLYPNGDPKPSHSTNPVNFFVISKDEDLKNISLRNGEMKDVAPTILEIMGFKKPKEMTGESLITPFKFYK